MFAEIELFYYCLEGVLAVNRLFERGWVTSKESNMQVILFKLWSMKEKHTMA